MMRVAAEMIADRLRWSLRATVVDLQRTVLDRLARKFPTELLDDVRIAATDELARRGLHVIAHRSRPLRKPKKKVI